MLFLPLADQRWTPPVLTWKPHHIITWGCLLLISGGMLLWQPQYLNFALSTLLLAAVPEEWFFRGYFMARMGGGWKGNLIASLLFSLLHGLTRGCYTALLVFTPSIFYGWLYQRTRDLPSLILLHTLSNILYAIFIASLLIQWIIDLQH